jgi:hypothetical protein
MIKNIKFIPSLELLDSGQEVISPIKSGSAIPEWYMKSEHHIVSEDEDLKSGIKACMPYLDSLISGYFILLQNNVYVTKENGNVIVEWEGNLPLVVERDNKLGEKMPRGNDNLINHMTWKGLWGIKVPKKHSVLFTHPLNRKDLPFSTVSSIVDSDKMHSWGNIPFFFDASFEGVIPAGTPICQIIPFKRESWAMSVDKSLSHQASCQGIKCRSVKRGYYRDNFWTKKRFL